MRRSVIFFVISLALNCLLLAALLVSHGSGSSTRPDSSAGQTTSVVTRTKPLVVVRKQSFSWNEVESPDYLTYIGNLREIGCPEQTIRDLVIADVDQLYDQKRMEEVPSPEQEWWRHSPDSNLVQAARLKIDALESERRALLNTLLGPNWHVEDVEVPRLALNGPVLGDLSADAKKAVRDIAAQAQRLRRDTPPTDRAGLAKIEEVMRSDLAKVLTPAQLEEYLLRFSSTATNLREQLNNFSVTPEEFKKIFDLQDAALQNTRLAEANALASPNAPILGSELTNALKNGLGNSRYLAYLQANDSNYQAAVNLADESGASSNVVNRLYQVNLLLAQERQRILSDSTLTPEQKAEQLKNVQDQVQAARDQLLGTPPPAPPLPPTPASLPTAAVHPYAPGETIDMIAARYGTTPTLILNANPELNFNALSRGAPIKIPAAPPPAPAPPPAY